MQNVTNPKLLVVQPEEEERDLMCKLVSCWGFVAEGAKDGVEAMTKLIAWSPHLVVTDLKLPKLDGFELLERIALDPRRSSVIVLTANGTIARAIKAIRLGAFEFVEKPMNPEQFRELLWTALREATDDGLFGAGVNQRVKRVPGTKLELEPGKTTVEQAERMLILRTLELLRNNKTKAAVVLDISLKTLHNKLKEYMVG